MVISYQNIFLARGWILKSLNSTSTLTLAGGVSVSIKNTKAKFQQTLHGTVMGLDLYAEVEN